MASYETLRKRILAMKLGQKATIYVSGDGTRINVLKPAKVSTNLKNSAKYNPKKNFRILLLKKGKDEFAPNHMRFMIDLDLKRRENPKKASILFNAIEAIYNGADPVKYKSKLFHRFDGEIETSFTDLCLSQLFMLEQDINYDFGKIQPPKAYMMGYIRMVRTGEFEIDKLLWSSLRNPPPKKFQH
jgi:hypothetical protein